MTTNSQPAIAEGERYLSDRFKWAAPGDQQEDVWLVRFCDNDVRDAIYTGPDAESEAWAAWNRHAPGYNMFVFRLAALAQSSTPPASKGGGGAGRDGGEAWQRAGGICHPDELINPWQDEELPGDIVAYTPRSEANHGS